MTNIISKGIDYAWGKPGGGNIKEAGYSFVCRYLTDTSKGLTADELDDLQSNGLKVALICEFTAQQSLRGYNQGQDDAKQMLDLIDGLNISSNPAVYFTVDFDASPTAHMPIIQRYFEGVNTVLPAERVGVYGGVKTVSAILDIKLAKYGWQTLAWSYGKWDNRAVLRQVKVNQKLKNVPIDINFSYSIDIGSI